MIQAQPSTKRVEFIIFSCYIKGLRMPMRGAEEEAQSGVI